ncbi:GPW/gp25 family protein [Pseudomonas aeruginosa]|uniref:GPW/gp25 family protein n=1 Tax=Pseudomonas aeruginosa TaxID=287 RepID=UPI002ADD50EA|nr:GPW/gp25 family protein [Pseudomonas aeruginosa]MEA0988985.1 GPW/gp25 family protein [Pseudomonas aeruginosa]HCF3047452.1 GPW/gp25 family protein [Pseudomonas aeruginosa]HCL3292905.1 GPW/gp25 family protein [Pseudomonas aeruginosa]
MSIQDNELTQLYGAGWRFPLSFELKPSSATGGTPSSAVVMSSGAENVAQSLALLFQTQPGERIMRSAYGCDLQSAVFANMSEGTLATLRSQIAESVARFEPRAEGVMVDVREDTTQRGTLRIEVTYRLAGQMQQVSGRLNLLDGMEGGLGTWATW